MVGQPIGWVCSWGPQGLAAFPKASPWTVGPQLKYDPGRLQQVSNPCPCAKQIQPASQARVCVTFYQGDCRRHRFQVPNLDITSFVFHLLKGNERIRFSGPRRISPW
jgi:hypothetical protein